MKNDMTEEAYVTMMAELDDLEHAIGSLVMALPAETISPHTNEVRPRLETPGTDIIDSAGRQAFEWFK